MGHRPHGELDALERTLLERTRAPETWTRLSPRASPRAREAFAAAQRQRNECVSGAFAVACRPAAALDSASREMLKLLRVSGVVAIQNVVDCMPEMQTRAMMHAMLLWCEYVEACGAALVGAAGAY